MVSEPASPRGSVGAGCHGVSIAACPHFADDVSGVGWYQRPGRHVKEVVVSTHITDVAKFLLETETEPMTTMKLQKLCYYAQAWHLAWYDEPLFPENFQAWVNGPVCPQLYALHRGKYSIDAQHLTSGDSTALSLPQKQHVLDIKNHYGQLSGAELSELTHQETPWRVARGESGPSDRSAAVIPQESLAMFYGALADA